MNKEGKKKKTGEPVTTMHRMSLVMTRAGGVTLMTLVLMLMLVLGAALVSSVKEEDFDVDALSFLPRFTNARYDIREGRLMSDSFKVALVKIEASEPIYLAQYVPCFTCWNNQTADALCTCDYSKKGNILLLLSFRQHITTRSIAKATNQRVVLWQGMWLF